MTLDTAHLNRCIATLDVSIGIFRKVAPGGIHQELFRIGIIKDYALAANLKELGNGA